MIHTRSETLTLVLSVSRTRILLVCTKDRRPNITDRYLWFPFHLFFIYVFYVSLLLFTLKRISSYNTISRSPRPSSPPVIKLTHGTFWRDHFSSNLDSTFVCLPRLAHRERFVSQSFLFELHKFFDVSTVLSSTSPVPTFPPSVSTRPRSSTPRYIGNI